MLLPIAYARRLPAYLVNGMSVAIGVGLVHLLIQALAGDLAAQVAMSGAVCASLADLPNTVERSWHRVSAAAMMSFIAAVTVAVLGEHPLALGFGVVGVGFLALMTMSWGTRAAFVAFAPVLSLVFAMAIPDDTAPPWMLVAWNAMGGISYLVWALISGHLLQPRYRTLSLAVALRAACGLLRARAALLTTSPSEREELGALRAWVKGEALMAEGLQSARDFIFAAPEVATAARQTQILLRIIDLRDLMLASRLDLSRFGNDEAGRWVMQRLAGALAQLASALEAASEAVQHGEAERLAGWPSFDAAAVFADPPEALADDARRRLLPGMAKRLHQLSEDIARIHVLVSMDDADADAALAAPGLTASELRQFVAPEGWPLKTLLQELSWQSPVGRHALRSALALGSAYYLGLVLPWASHPHWLVLSVGVVLRGNLEQTLSRRNARVSGTMVGCVLVMVIAALPFSPWLVSLFYLMAVGTAHSFNLQRYWVTSVAATVMALLQTHRVDPAGGFPIAERAADTVLGALLAWAFSYVLPFWERRNLRASVERVLNALSQYAGHVLSDQPIEGAGPRMARQRAYDALNALGGMLQRSAVEPAWVRVPVPELAALLDHGQRLMADLSSVRMVMAQRRDEIAHAEATAALTRTHSDLLAALALQAPASEATASAEARNRRPLPISAANAEPTLPWLLRRLEQLEPDAQQIRLAAQALLEKAGTR